MGIRPQSQKNPTRKPQHKQRVKYRILRTLSTVRGDPHVAEACMAINERLRHTCCKTLVILA